jgi:hypothetical protein
LPFCRRSYGIGMALLHKSVRRAVKTGRKVHLGIDAATLEIRAIEVTDNATGDAPMLPCRSTRSPMTKSSRASVATAPTTRRAVMRPLRREVRSEVHRQSSRRAKMPSRGRIDVPAPLPATPSWTPRAGLAGQYGRSGLAIIDVASSKPKCVASSCSVNGLWRVTSTAKSQSCRYVQTSSIATHGWARPRPSLCRKFLLGFGVVRAQLIYATKPRCATCDSRNAAACARRLVSHIPGLPPLLSEPPPSLPGRLLWWSRHYVNKLRSNRGFGVSGF